MRYYRVNEDWLTYLVGDFRTEVLATIRGLSLERLQKYPPPKLNGLPFGNESRVFLRYLKGKSSQLDASALSSLYGALASSRDKLLYNAFRRNDKLSRDQWSGIIGAENVEKWVANKCLRYTQDQHFVCQFSVVCVDNLIFVVDPLNDHGNPTETLALADDDPDRQNGGKNIRPFHHTYIGLDSLRQIEVMQSGGLPGGGRYMDCGPGAGAIMLYFGRWFGEAVGIDINARAAKLCQFNADLNNLRNCRVYEDDAINLNGRYGKFDLISWNLPFIFMPEEQGENSIDAFGGEMGIGLCLKFIDTLPELLEQKGVACVAALSPIMQNGENVLEQRLKQKLKRLGLDCSVRVAQISLAPTLDLWQFHKSFGIRKFESVYLYLRNGNGDLSRVETTMTRKVIDTFRERLYQRKFN